MITRARDRITHGGEGKGAGKCPSGAPRVSSGFSLQMRSSGVVVLLREFCWSSHLGGRRETTAFSNAPTNAQRRYTGASTKSTISRTRSREYETRLFSGGNPRPRESRDNIRSAAREGVFIFISKIFVLATENTSLTRAGAMKPRPIELLLWGCRIYFVFFYLRAYTPLSL